MKVYVSSTFADLQEYRRAVYAQLRKLNLDVVAMEDYVAGERRPLAQCIQDVAEADIYIGIFAWRYGYIPNEDNPDRLSITELEYRAAGEREKERLIFLLRDDAPWNPRFMDSHSEDGDGGNQIQRLRGELGNRHMVGFFSTPDELAKEISAAVSRILVKRNPAHRSGLDISDIQLIPDKTAYTCTVDFRVSNPTDVDIQINRIQFEVIDVYQVETLGYLDFSQVYDLDISSLTDIGDRIICNVSQVIKPGEVDRFGVRLIATQLGVGVFRIWTLRPTLMTSMGEVHGPSFEVWLPYQLEEGSLKEFRERFEAYKRRVDEKVRKGKA